MNTDLIMTDCFMNKCAWILVLMGLGSLPASAIEPGMKTLPGHVPPGVAALSPKGVLAPTNHLNLAIGLPLRDARGLSNFLAQVYDPASPHYRHYLTPAEFTERFGPTESDYAAVIQFAKTNGLTLTATHANRLLLDVNAAVADIQRAFHITLRTYQHPTEPREFFAPDTEPSVDARLPVVDVSGLNNYTLPRPKSVQRALTNSPAGSPNTGSAPTGDYMGNDFRAAYLPGVTLTGLGQSVGLFQLDGFYYTDILAYEAVAGLPAVPIQTVLLDGFDGVPTIGSANTEVSLDIEMALLMAPGLSQIVVFEGGPGGIPNDILNAMAASNSVLQLSCSWRWAGGPTTTTDSIFQQMAAQGQSFFDASGDSDAFTLGPNSSNGVDNASLSQDPASSPYVTQVGGTTLSTTAAGGAWSSEKVWNWGLNGGSYVGSSGGVSSYYPIPSWQTNVSMAANGGLTVNRNIPDVALVADGVYVLSGNGAHASLGGTSVAAPLWAGLAALINQQAATEGQPPIGLINSAVYAIGAGSLYSSTFHDITNGNNVSKASPNQYYAATGYDLCTGWGTPMGQALIDALAGPPGNLRLSPTTGFAASGPVGGPFNVISEAFLLTNVGPSGITWSLINTSAWLSVSSTAGALNSGASTSLTVGLTPAAGALDVGSYEGTLVFTDLTSQAVQTLVCSLQIGLSIVLNGDFEFGDFSYWKLTGRTETTNYIYNAVEYLADIPLAVHSGNFGAFLGDTKIDTLSQSLSTVPGQNYLLSLWLDNPTNGGPQNFAVRWNTNSPAVSTLYLLASPPAFDWTNLMFLVSATGTNTVLQFAAQNNDNFFGVDDVSVIPIPAVQFQTALPNAGNVTLSWLAATGLVYQVQFTTDLTQTNWTTLGAPIVATNSAVTVVDADAVPSSTQKFYRLVAAP